MPTWCRVVGWKRYNEDAWDLKRGQLRTQLDAETYTDTFPPSRGWWTVRGNTISLGVDDYRTTLQANEYPSQIIDDTACFAGVMGFDKNKTVEMLQRGDPAYELPNPPPVVEEPPSVEEQPRPGIFTRLRQALG